MPCLMDLWKRVCVSGVLLYDFRLDMLELILSECQVLIVPLTDLKNIGSLTF